MTTGASKLPPGAAAHPPFSYRPDIDGLRAVAVLGVVLFHLRLPFLPGGFVGVDIFFVISGYLISAIILRDIRAGRFSILDFYERRIRRIFPAMLAMFAVVTALATWLLLPLEVVAFGQSLLGALFSVSNFVFWHQAGYFDMASSYKPLLHTWSLAVEEQFYLFFPPFLLLLRRVPERWLKWIILTVAAVSLVASALVVHRDPTEAFYFTPLRAWELLLGTILSQHYLPRITSAAGRHVASLAGLTLMLAPMMLYRESTVFPGLSAVPPCLGAALVIAAGETGKSLGGRLLAWRPVVFVGLISYSLYLWHWPVMVFQTTDNLLVPARYAGRHLNAPVELAAALVLGTLSWRFIERPFRSGALRLPRRQLFAASAAVVAMLSLAGGLLLALHGLPGRYPAEARAVAAHLGQEDAVRRRNDVCFITPAVAFSGFDQSLCLGVGAVRPPGRKSVLLLGDSHAASLYPGVKAAFAGSDVWQANASACRPVLDASGTRDAGRQGRNCRELLDFVFKDFLPGSAVDLVILAGDWRAEDLGPLGRTVEWFAERRIPVVLAGPNPGFNAPLPRLLANALRSGEPDSVALAQEDRRPRELDREMARRSAETWHVRYVSFFDEFCRPACPAYAAPQIPLLTDVGHLSPEAGVMYAQAIRRAAESAGLYGAARLREP